MAEAGYYGSTATTGYYYGSGYSGCTGGIRTYHTGGGMSMDEYRAEQREKKMKRLIWLGL